MSVISALARFAKRSRPERGLVARTAIIFVVAHLLMRMHSLAGARSRIARVAKILGARARDGQQLAWVINAVERNLPGRHSCLIQAVCCEGIAANSGIATQFNLGAARGRDSMHFHAWVDHAGCTIAGAHDGQFIPFR